MLHNSKAAIGQTTGVRVRVIVSLLVLVGTLANCADAPNPGNAALFCELLRSGSGLSGSPEPADLAALASAAPPEISETITALQNRARDFSELRAEDPPDLEALFNARFDPAARTEQIALDLYAEEECQLEVNRPAGSRWNAWQLASHADAPWVPLSTLQFDVNADRIEAVTVLFSQPPAPRSLIQDACRAVAEFVAADGADESIVRVMVGSVVAVEHQVPGEPCTYP